MTGKCFLGKNNDDNPATRASAFWLHQKLKFLRKSQLCRCCQWHC